MGSLDGHPLGLDVGSLEGRMVGALEGRMVGALEGGMVGATDGMIGESVDERLGTAVGLLPVPQSHALGGIVYDHTISLLA